VVGVEVHATVAFKEGIAEGTFRGELCEALIGQADFVVEIASNENLFAGALAFLDEGEEVSCVMFPDLVGLVAAISMEHGVLLRESFEGMIRNCVSPISFVACLVCTDDRDRCTACSC
jgi:hypothetical protein